MDRKEKYCCSCLGGDAFTMAQSWRLKYRHLCYLFLLRHVCNGEILGVSLLMEDVLLSEESQLPPDIFPERAPSAVQSRPTSTRSRVAVSPAVSLTVAPSTLDTTGLGKDQDVSGSGEVTQTVVKATVLSGTHGSLIPSFCAADL